MMNVDATKRLILSGCDATFLEGLAIKYSIVSMIVMDVNTTDFCRV